MSTKLIRVYHLVQLLTTQDNPLSGLHWVPASWVKWQDRESTKVLQAYPDEPQEITRERVKNYEDPKKYWNMSWAQIQYTINPYDGTIRDVNECGRSVEDSSSGKVNCTEVESPNASSSLKASLSSEVNDSDTFSSEFRKWLSRQPNSEDPRMSMVNRIDEIISIDSEVTDQEDVDGDDKDFPLDLSMPSKIVEDSTSKSMPDLRQVNDTNGIPYDPSTRGDTDMNLTLKHHEHAPELIELIPNSGVYITFSELDRCLKSSTKCTKLYIL